MSLKNEKDLSEFGKKLLYLMEKKGCDSPKMLATILYDKSLVTVNSHGTDIYKIRDNAVGSIEKKIRKHIHADNAECLQGEFVKAYCTYFECSADFLFGYTEIESPDMSIRQICEKTGLSEKAVSNLIESATGSNKYYSRAWSMMMESELFSKVPEEWLAASNQAILVAQKEAELKKEELELENTTGPERLDIQNNIEGYLRDSQSGKAAMAGLLFNISRNFAAFIEEQINFCLKPFREKLDLALMKEK